MTKPTLLREQLGDGVAADFDVEPGAGGEGHLQQRGEQPAVRSVVVAERPAAFMQRTGKFDQRLERRRVVHVGRFVAECAEALRQGTAAEAASRKRRFDQIERLAAAS